MTLNEAKEKAEEYMEIFEIKCDQCEMFEDCLFYKTCLVRDELIADYLGKQ